MSDLKDVKPSNSSKRQALKDPDYKGEDYTVNQELKDGPIKERKCTDIFCILLFILFAGTYIYSIVYGYQNNHIHQLLHPVNGDGKLCGIDDLEEYPNLYYLVKAKSKEMKAVCVK